MAVQNAAAIDAQIIRMKREFTARKARIHSENMRKYEHAWSMR
jgi:hypothetical protein